MNDQEQLRWSDAWLLLAIYFASRYRKPNLPDIIAAADYINHAIITFEELSSGLVRLKSEGFIQVDDIESAISCSESCIEFIEPMVQHTRYVDAARKEIERVLKVVPWSPADPLPSPEDCLEFPGLTEVRYNNAVKDYTKRAKKKRQAGFKNNGRMA